LTKPARRCLCAAPAPPNEVSSIRSTHRASARR
jgi:hypothetical protein